jgi:hypothetical protein
LIAAGAVAWLASQPTMAVPDDRLTPGDVATADPDVICRMGYAGTQRLAQRIGLTGYAEVRDEVFMRYSVPGARRRAYQIDDRTISRLRTATKDGDAGIYPWCRFASAVGNRLLTCGRSCGARRE